MSSIIISADQDTEGQAIAAKVAEQLGYRHVGRDLLSKVANEHHVPEEKLALALEETSSRLKMSRKTRALCLAYIQSVALARFLDDGVVCEGIAAHLYVRDVSHVLMVRVLSDLRLRANRIAADKNVSPRKARKVLERQEKRRRGWSMNAFGLDESNPSLYDIVISLSHIEPERAVKIISDTVQDRKFEPMTYSKKCVQDMALAARVRVALMERFPSVAVQARDGTVVVQVRKIAPNWRKKAEIIKKAALEVTGVDYVEVHRGLSSGARVEAPTR